MPSALPGDTGKVRKGAEPKPVEPGLSDDETLPKQQRRFDRTARLIDLLKPVRRALLDGGAFAAFGR